MKEYLFVLREKHIVNLFWHFCRCKSTRDNPLKAVKMNDRTEDLVTAASALFLFEHEVRLSSLYTYQ